MRRASPAMRSALTFIAGWGLLSPLGTAAREQPPSGVDAGPPPPEEVVVEGRHEGPRMWTVRKGAHTLWILGTISPLPKRMVWQPDAVQEVLRNVQEVVPAWPAYSIGANPLTALRVYIEWRHLQKPPDHMPLKQALPPPLYARVETLKARFDPNDSKLEEMRPMLAARQLLMRVLDASGLAVQNEVQHEVLRLARSQGVRVHQDKLRIEDPVKVLKEVEATPLSGEVACLDAVVTLLETDLAPMQAKARAWALGDVDTLRRLPHADDRTACLAAVSGRERRAGRAPGQGVRRRGPVSAVAVQSSSAQLHAIATEPSAAAPVSHCGVRSNAARTTGSAASAPSAAPTANPATCATRSVPSPADPVQPSRMTPATSGPQRRAQRWGNCRRSRQE
ncbi:MAG: hypothetical protein E6K46_07700 [Gammaproteobacteria bacterium]|nr:MAG: hypothetical protein E6K46_07700 [Gammaproteobacteria bacterium]